MTKPVKFKGTPKSLPATVNYAKGGGTFFDFGSNVDSSGNRTKAGKKRIRKRGAKNGSTKGR